MRLFYQTILIIFIFQVSEIFAHSDKYKPYTETFLESEEKYDKDVHIWRNYKGKEKVNAFVGTDEGIFFDEYVLHLHMQFYHPERGFEWHEVYLDMFDEEAEKALNGTLDLTKYLQSEDVERQLEGFGIFISIAGAVILCLSTGVCVPVG